MNPDESKIIEFLKNNGPSLPSEIKAAIKKDLILTGAILADLVARRVIKMSFGKIGGSNLYYLPGQEEKLDRLYDYLRPPEKEVFDLLKEKKLILENELSPLHQVVITKLKDFAKSLIVEYDNKEYRFWKWHLVSNEEAKKLIENILTQKNENNTSKDTENKNINADKESIKETKEEIKLKGEKEQKQEVKEMESHETNKKEESSAKEDEQKSSKDEEIQKDKSKEERLMQKGKIDSENRLIDNLKINHRLQLKQWIEKKNITPKKVLLNSKGFAIVECTQELLEMVIGYHEKRKVTENDLLLFYGYCQYSKKPGILLYETSLNSKAQEILKSIPVKIINVKNKLKQG